MTETITSLQNPKIKQLLVLQQKSSERRKTGLFVVEGQQEMAHCLHAGYEVDTVFYCPSLLPDFQVPQHARCFEVSREVYEKVAYRGSTEGVIAEVKTKHLSLDDLTLSSHPLIVVLESVEKPGNLGAILRSADASGVDAVVVCDPLTDLYNPNLIRSSVGAAFSVPCVACSSETCISFLKQRNIKILTAQLQDSHLYLSMGLLALDSSNTWENLTLDGLEQSTATSRDVRNLIGQTELVDTSYRVATANQ